jgi:hypothetical protein
MMVPDALGFIVARLELKKPEDCWKIESVPEGEIEIKFCKT